MNWGSLFESYGAVFLDPQVLLMTLVGAVGGVLLGAIPGGLLGAYLLDRLKPSVLQLIFAALLLFSGWRMAFPS